MNRYLRYALIVIALVTVLLLGLIIYFAIILDPNSYKPLLAELVKEKNQRELRLDGDITLSLFPRLGIELGPITLSERNSNVEFASAERILVSLALLPLLRKQLELDGILIKGLKANLIRLKDGSINIADLIAKSEETGQFKLNVGRVATEKARVTFSDEESGRHFAFTDLNVEADRLGARGLSASAVRSKVKLGFAVGRSEGTEVDLATRLAFDLTLDVDKQYYAVQGVRLESKGQLPGISQFMLNCTGDFVASVPSESVTAEFMASDVAINLTGIRGLSNLDIKLYMPRLSLANEKLGGDKISVAAEMSGHEGKLNVNARVSLSALEASVSGLRSGALLVELEAVKNDWTIHTMLESPFSSNPTTWQLNLPEVKGVMHARGPGLANPGIDGALRGSVAIDVESRNAQADFTGQFADTNIKAKLMASAAVEPSLIFDVNIDQLDLDRFLPPAQPPGENLEKKGNAYASEQWLDLSALDNLSLEGSIRIGLLKTANSRLSGLSLAIRSN
ncbi:AsmA family protein [Nitrosospira sp. Is2]|uniref:AsmA family protein n=1 Tax=Nitrosospira sp. Is2 TaxID=3080532 RepID=UPI002954882E|nr:AsmA family protein [Nitrosospira sp. Is2]WON75373.1 AsmA family protein [Nitrosospira sp. Is2]